MFSWRLLVIFCGVFVGKSTAQNCVIAPDCPNIIPWSNDYTCGENKFQNITKIASNGFEMNVICCSETCVNSCDNGNQLNDPLCEPPSCDNIWRKWEFDLAPLNDGIIIKNEHSVSFVGRLLLYDDYFHPGLIVLNQGIKYLYGGNEFTKNQGTKIEYLVMNEKHSYKWIEASNASYVNSAVHVASSNDPYIAKTVIGGITHIGGIFKATDGNFYSDWSANVSLANKYEVLTCSGPPLNSNIVAPNCAIEWKPQADASSISTFVTALSDLSVPSILLAPAHINIGDNTHIYNWKHLDEALKFLPATIIMPNGLQFNVGRSKNGNNMAVGPVDNSTGIMQTIDESGMPYNVYSDEILVCDEKISQTTTSSVSQEEICVHTWKTYNPLIQPDLSKSALNAHPVGYITEYSPYKLATPSRNIKNFCIDLKNGICTSAFDYLTSNAFNVYSWITSNNGEVVPNAVPLKDNSDLFIGAALINGNYKIGLAANSIGLTYFEDGLWKNAKSYQVLTCKVKSIAEMCTSTWQKYKSTSELIEFGVTAGMDQYSPIYIGIASDDFIVKVTAKPINFQSFCYRFGNKCIDDFKFLKRSSDMSYDWIASANGTNVDNAVRHRTFYIGKATTSEGAQLGIVVSKVGLVYVTDENVWGIEKNYFVLVCNEN